MSPHISLRDYAYRHASRRRFALENISFDIEAGEKVLLLGASGSGKSTLLHSIAGLLGEDEGEHSGHINVQGICGMVLQDPDAQVISQRVGDDVAFGCENLQIPREEIWRRVPRALEQVGLDLPLDHPTHALSGGQKQRLALAGVLAMGADIVLLDEPTANLDPQGVEEVVAAASRLDTTLIVVEHRVATWVEHVDRIIVIGQTGVLADGTPEAVLEQQGARLAAEGVWVPGVDPDLPDAKPECASNAPALEGIDLRYGWDHALGHQRLIQLPRGCSTVITGANGTGKTTLMLTLAGLLDPHGGQVRASKELFGTSTLDPRKWKSQALAQRIGYVFQDPEHQFVAKTVREEMLVGLRARGEVSAADERRADEVLETLGLDALAEANPFTLSGGQKRRLSVATVLIHSPKIMLLDEPTFGQDRKTFLALVELLSQQRDQGLSVCSITHDALFRRALGDQEIQL
ncbi:ABC transporter ATP-binding protein [Corynebacterium pseudopelargi]|uniref:HMP/thiamine import ATP-binding protein YkoD n=1 Tax=Corynebacterium pseudopelargi TaxID=2080757 RepID=A0A3G6IV41_9CORY|nr:ABC transporter ATP-binding protein [Corynebacterium pseudopelargi]AZA09572.1 Putative HMP/thiamine import ATP-binding protein YkoD [Corynebacterium pseudopelargi]